MTAMPRPRAPGRIDARHDAGRAGPLLRRCRDCGRPLGHKDRFCPFCGARQPREPAGKAVKK
jgi:hypothetical protein